VKINSYRDYSALRNELLEIVQSIRDVAAGIELGEQTLHSLTRVGNMVSNDVFRIMFVGSFSRGKSTMINALLGQDILPAKLAPTTAIITVIKYGDTPRATLFYKDGVRAPLEVPINELRHHLIIPKGAFQQTEYGNKIETQYEKMEIEYPLELCQDGVEIVDSPGLEEDEVRARITLTFLNQADAAVVLLSCQQLITLEEERFIKDELQRRGFDNIFYTVNFCDELETSEDEEDLRHRCDQKLGKPDRLYMLSAREALHGKMDGDVELLNKSRFLKFQQDLETFLVREKGLRKFRTSTKMINAIIDELLSLAQVRWALIEQNSATELEAKEREFARRQTEIIKRKETVLARIGEKGAFMAERICSSFSRKCLEISRSLEDIAKESDDESIGVIGVLLDRTKYQHAVAAKMEQQVRAEFKKWAETEVPALLQVDVQGLKQSIESELEIILSDIEDLKVLLDPRFERDTAGKENVMERFIAGLGGLLFFDIGTALAGDRIGLEAAIQDIVIIFAGNVALFVLGILNPFTAVAMTAGAAYWVITSKGEKMKEEIRLRLATELRPKIDALPSEQEDFIREKVFGEINRLAKAIHIGVESLLDDIGQQFKIAKRDIVRDREKVVAECKEVVDSLHGTKKQLSELESSWMEETSA